MSDSVYQFDDIALNWKTRKLLRAGVGVAVEPKVLELILYLLRHRDRAVGKDELAQALWPDRVISDSVISQTVRKARIAVDDTGERQKVIETVRGFGFRFVATLGEPALDVTKCKTAGGTGPPRRPLTGRQSRGMRLAAYAGVLVLMVGAMTGLFRHLTSDTDRGFNPARATLNRPVLVAVLPFHHDHSSISDRALAQSLAEALHMRLIDIPGIEFRSPRVVGLLLEEESGLAELMTRAEVDFVLSGTLEPGLASDRRELGLELTHNAGAVLQAVPLGQYSIPFPESRESLAEFMQTRDAIIERLTRTLLPAMAPSLTDRPAATFSPDAFRLLLASIRDVRAVKCDNRELEALLQRAIELDSNFDHARMAQAWVAFMQYRNCDRSPEQLARAEEQIERVLTGNAQHPVALLIHTLIKVENGMIEEAFERLAPALDQNPSSPQVRLSLAHALTFGGFLDAASAELDKLIDSDPLFLSFEKPHLPLAYLHQGRLEDFLRTAPSLDTPSFRYYRAVAELRRGNEAAARTLLQPASRAHPADLASHMSEALLAILDGQMETATAIVEEIDPATATEASINGETLFQLGRLLNQAGAQEQALDRFERALNAGFFCPDCLQNDSELADLSTHPRWLAILNSARQRQIAMAARPSFEQRLSRHNRSGPPIALGTP
ncbi:winged helix-turn-helix domain-containing protein [Roseovarius sp.]|uniref:winged helix-turn-helix domain-containing protein n=1 Tax=Roseovarius sp. TaxID=1486281 RepID=UPI00356AEAE5